MNAPARRAEGGFWTEAAGCVRVAVRVQPKSRRPGLQGHAPDPQGTRLRIGVTEAAEDGRASRAACAVLAEALGVPAATVSVAAGAASRLKTLLVVGDEAALSVRLERLGPLPSASTLAVTVKERS